MGCLWKVSEGRSQEELVLEAGDESLALRGMHVQWMGKQ